MPHQICEKRKVVEFREKVLGKAMTKGMRVNDLCINAIAFSEYFQLITNASSGDTLAKPITEEIAA